MVLFVAEHVLPAREKTNKPVGTDRIWKHSECGREIKRR